MTTLSGTNSNSKKTVFKEPTYTLEVTPQRAYSKDVKKTDLTYKSLEHLVDTVMEQRYGDKLKKLPKSKQQKLRYQVAHSLIERNDQTSVMKIKGELAQAQGLKAHALERLNAVAAGFPAPTKFKLDETLNFIVDFLFSDKNNDHSQLQHKFSLDSTPLRNAVLAEARKIQTELEQLTHGKTKYLRPQTAEDGLNYLDHEGKTVLVSRAIPSSFDRENPDVQNSRQNLDTDGHVVYSTGRIETERKANQAISELIFQTFNSRQLRKDNLVKEGDSYIFPVVIENLINATPFAQKENERLRLEKAVLEKMNGEKRSVILPSGEVITIKLELMHFSTQANYNELLGQKHEWIATGSDVGEGITRSGTAALQAYYNKVRDGLDDNVKALIDGCFTRLQKCSLSNRLILRALICELLNIPYHAHCNSSKDRTIIAAAIKKAIHLWMKVEKWKSNGEVQIPNVDKFLDEFFKSNIFREYSEAAFFEDLPSTEQGVGISGVLDGKLYTQNRGFAFNSSLLENPLPSLLLTDRHIRTASMLERLVHAAMASIASIAITVLCIAFSVIIISILAVKYKSQLFTAGRYILLALILLPTQSAFRKKWLNRASTVLKEREFIKTKHKAEIAPDLKEMYLQVNRLSQAEHQNILQFMQSGDQTLINSSHIQLLETMTKNWVVLQDASSVPSRVKTLLAAAKKSPVLLFRTLTELNQEKVMAAIEDTHFFWPTENSSQELVRFPVVNGHTNQFTSDIHRTHFIVHGKKQTYNLPVCKEAEKEEKLVKIEIALHELSALSGEKVIPYGVQQVLSQKTELATLLSPMFQASIDEEGPPPAYDRTFILEEGDSTYFWLTVKETAGIREGFERVDGPSAYPLSFEYSYRMKIAKSDANIWTTELVSMTPWHPVPGTAGIGPLLRLPTKIPDASSKQTSDYVYTSYFNLLKDDIKALAEWNKDSPIPIGDVHREMKQHFNTLSTRYIDKFIQDPAKCVQAINAQYNKAKTPEGQKLLLQALVSYVSLLEEADIIALDLPSGVLKAVLHPRTYQRLCIANKELDPTAEMIPTLDGTFPVDRFSKEHKYRYVFDELIKLQPTLPNLDGEEESELKTKCIALRDLINNPQADARVQYQAFVQQLRAALEIAPKNGICSDWLKQLALHRFAGIQLHEYCKGLVETVTGPFDRPLTLDNFWDEFQERNGQVKSMSSEHGISWIARHFQGLRSTILYHFDALAKFNVPYIYGKLTVGNEDDAREVTVLRHGTPFHHHNPLSFLRRIFRIEKEVHIPEATPDYHAFKSNPAKRILHIILENGDKKIFGGEDARVQGRKDLDGGNFYAVALRMNGDFVTPKHYAPKTIAQTKSELRAQLLGSYDETRFSIPGDIENREELIDNAMDRIQELYFSKHPANRKLTKEQFQAFIFLTYAQMTLQLCYDLKIDILEAGCKDDIDRGGAFKAILMLHDLHVKQQLTHEKLQEIMVNLLAAPLIVAKRPIVESRGNFVRNVLEVIPTVG